MIRIGVGSGECPASTLVRRRRENREKKHKVGGNGDREKRAASAYNLVLQAKVEEL
jgi:hypothetical protein